MSNGTTIQKIEKENLATILSATRFRFSFAKKFISAFVLRVKDFQNISISKMEYEVIRLDFQRAFDIGKEKYPRVANKYMMYGTAGFRDRATELPYVMYRTGLLAVLRSKSKNGATIGIMITASHNPEEDNGVKICDPSGGILEREWESFATNLVNANDEDLISSLLNIVQSCKINYNIAANIYLAKDTRKNSPNLANAALAGINALKGQVKDFGLLTTPQLQYVVCCKNYPSYGLPTAEGYYEKLSSAFNRLCDGKMDNCGKYQPFLHVDCANGIGALKLKELLPYLNFLHVDLFNDGSTGILNYKCGADYVKVSQKLPEGIIIPNERYASFDGDADRLIYFYKDEKDVVHLLDGDKIATLFAKYLKEIFQAAELNYSLHVIQTAYANASSTNYIENILKIPVICVCTGVKNLHHEAQKYDVGIYFEANGHGTVLFSDALKHHLKTLQDDINVVDKQKSAAQKLLHTINLINETTGDAISDLLLVEVILCENKWSISDWDQLYVDIPYRQLKVKIPDRNVISTIDADRVCVEPKGLQDEIDLYVSKYEKSRAFVRPSGTENFIRVYAEADTQEHADLLAQEISSVVEKFCI